MKQAVKDAALARGASADALVGLMAFPESPSSSANTSVRLVFM